ncbi:MAG TPA: DciA family protein [Vicinamibacterales bacterium]
MQTLQETSMTVVRRLLSEQPTTAAKVVFAWQVAAGVPLARNGLPEWRGDGTLRVRAKSGAWHRELASSRGVVLERMAEILGRGVVTHIVIREPLDQS